jgi:uncharacterized phage protein (TIGR02218 family)
MTSELLNSLAFGWRLERRDGVTLGFTSHDRDVVFDGLKYSASPGMAPSTIVQSEGLEGGGLDVSGALSAAAITEDDLRSGRWDRAALEIFLFDWADTSVPRTLLAAGELGEVSFSSEGFQAEFLGPGVKLDRPAVPKTSPSCRADFCGKECGLNRRRFQYFGSVLSVNGDNIAVEGLPAQSNGLFAYGSVRWLTGENTGLQVDIVSNSTNQIRLAIEPPNVAVEGEMLLITQGCNKTMETCSSRFGNALNFRGEPFLPGNDLLTRYRGG